MDEQHSYIGHDGRPPNASAYSCVQFYNPPDSGCDAVVHSARAKSDTAIGGWYLHRHDVQELSTPVVVHNTDLGGKPARCLLGGLHDATFLGALGTELLVDGAGMTRMGKEMLSGYGPLFVHPGQGLLLISPNWNEHMSMTLAWDERWFEVRMI